MTADVLIPKGQLEAMALPAVCVRSGEPVTTSVNTGYYRQNVFTYAWLLLPGLGFVVMLALMPRINVRLPASRRVVIRMRLVATLVALAGVPGAMLLMVAMLTFSWQFAIVAGALIGTATATHLRFWPTVWIRGRLLKDGNLLLMGVHPAFAEATAAITRRGPA